MAGKTEENLESLEVLTYDGARLRVGPTSEEDLAKIIEAGGRKGELYAGLKTLRDRYADDIRAGFPNIRRRVSGYNLDALLPENGFNVARALVGSEGTCAVTLSARTKLVHSPPYRTLLALGYADVYTAGDRAPAMVQQAAICCEGLDDNIVDDMRKKGFALHDLELLPQGRGWLLVEFGGDSADEANEKARAALAGEGKRPTGSEIYGNRDKQNAIWGVRSSGAAATSAVPGQPEAYPGWEDAAVDPEKVGDYLREFNTLLGYYGYKASNYGHFGDGCIHNRITFDFSSRDGLKQWRRFMEEAADLVVRYGGSLSGEHGDGQARSELLPRMYGDTLMAAFGEFKTLWDPNNRLNPGKLVDAYPFDADLRTGPDHNPTEPETFFAFQRDEGSFANAAGRCVGAGVCRRHAGGTMCPSYRATGEESYSTRGRARLLFEMLQGDPLKGAWDNETIHDSLDLCLACKGCRGDCPVQVDMATYKAEFMAHYYENHRRPRQAYAMGMIHQWARAAAYAPGLVNFFTQTPGLRDISKRIANLAPQRQLPAFARRTFQREFVRRQTSTDGNRPRVLLWPDTFNNHFHPQTALAAVSVLEDAGYRVEVPGGFVCCGRPLYAVGLLEQARKLLRGTMDTLEDAVRDEIPVVGLEPSCMVTFRDELPDLFPNDERAAALKENTWLLPDFLAEQTGYAPELSGSALVHGHCHQKALTGMDGTRELLSRCGLDTDILDSGCCGMAGSFGFEPDKYGISMKVGEDVLLPAVRGAGEDTLIISDGYSCREQVYQALGRRPLHTAEVLNGLTLSRR